MRDSVGIVGAGVSGLTCGILFAEAGYAARILADEIGAHTTSAVAAAIWFPYDAEPAEAVIAWSLETFRVLAKLCHDPTSGVSMLELRQFSRAGDLEIPSWATSLGARSIDSASIPRSFRSGFALQVPLTDTTRYLDYLAERFRRAGGEIVGGVHLNALEEVAQDLSLVINCTGIGAADLVPDSGLEPHRGQVVLVAKSDLTCAVVCDDPPLMYAIPRADDCVLGGTNELSADRNPNPAQTKQIVAECSRVLATEPLEVLGERVGFRPYRRAGVCLRAEKLRDRRRVIHNYGHGGSGFTLSWGCAQAVLTLTQGRSPGSTESRVNSR